MYNPLELSGRRILVTGASSGIGRATAVVLSELNAQVVLAARDEGRLAETRERMKGERHAIMPIDLSNPGNLPAWVKSVAADGPLYGLVHCAGIRTTIGLRDLSAAQLEETMVVNFTSAVMLAKGFRQKGCFVPGGGIVFLSSVAGFIGSSAIAAYASSKAALIGLTKSLSIELARQHIRVNCVAPGIVESEMLARIRESLLPEQYETMVAMHPLGTGTTRDVANSIAFLLAETGRWITGSVLVVDGGYSAQ